MNYLIYPIKIMNITQTYKNDFSHSRHTVGTPKDYPIDDNCGATGPNGYFYCPCDAMTVKKIYGVGSSSTNVLWLESTTPVITPTFSDYVTIMIGHIEDAELNKLKIGQTFTRKEPIAIEGKDGFATGEHFHIVVGRGKFRGSGWVKNTNDIWVINTTGGSVNPEDAFFIDNTFTTVINSAGLSPAMSDPETILRVNALGTVYMNQEFSKVMKKGSVIVDIASNSAYILPNFLISTKVYKLADTDEELFVKKLLKKSNLAKSKGAYAVSGFAYSLSKNFVTWYAKKCAFEYGKNGIRVVSLSPGLISTDMGNLEAKDGGMLIPFSAEERMGTPEELGFAIATVTDERNGYLAGVDVLVDGGSTNGMKEFKRKK